MKRIMKTLLTLLIITFSLTIQAKDNDVKKDFEESFGNYGSENLNNTISNFDLFLETHYPNLNPTERFRNYLNEFVSGEAPEWKMKIIKGNEIADPLLIEYNYKNKDEVKKDSPLFGQKILFLPDTVYREGNAVKSIYSKPFKLTQSSRVPTDEYLESNIALIAEDAKKGYIELVGKEQFDYALNKIIDKNILVNRYLKAKVDNSNLSKKEVCALILEFGNGNEYFAKRILVWEMNK